MRSIARAVFSLVLVYGCNACGGGTPTAAQGEPAGTAAVTPTPGSSTGSEQNAQGTADSTDLAGAQNRFAIDLYHQLRTTDGNLAMSPASISLALGMTMAGARGETRDVMARALHVDGIDDPHAQYASQLARWNDPSRTAYELRVANRLFGERSLRFHDDFVRLTADRYGAPLEPVDFASSPGAVRTHINGWVEDRTNDRIQELLPDGSISTETRLVLTNAIYFKGRWAREFDRDATRSRSFTLTDGSTADVPTMHQRGTFAHANVDGAQLLELPYVGGELSMVLLLPNEPSALAALEERLTAEKVSAWMSSMSEHELAVALPRFEIDPPRSIELGPPLAAMGMELPFTPAADFSGMSDAPLSISEVFHKAFVEVNEEGTEAAAATAVVMNERAGPAGFEALHPFLFLIKDRADGSILFMGRVSDPRT